MTPEPGPRVATSVRAAVQADAGLPEPLPWVRDGDLDLRYLQRQRPSADRARTMSIIIPSWNSEHTLAACVASIVQASAVLKPQCQVEIIVVDDESRLAASDVLRGLVEADVQIVRVAHGGQSLASNAGAQRAVGELLVFCDSDMLLNPWALSDLRSAAAYRPDALCFGFRENVPPTDRRVDPAFFRTGPGLVSTLHLRNDDRFTFNTYIPGVPMHLFAATRQLRDLTGFRHLRPPGRSAWWLARMAYGCLLACSRARFLRMGGFDGRFAIWGFNDTELATRWIASGGVLLPVFSANGLHVRHPPRHPRQWRDAGLSRRLYEDALAEDWPREPLATARTLSVSRAAASRLAVQPPAVGQWEPASTLEAAAVAGDRDLFEEAAGVRADDAVSDPQLSAQGLRVLRLSARSGYLDATVAFGQSDGTLELALLALALGETAQARRYLATAARDPAATGGTARYLLGSPAHRLWRIAEQHARHGLSRAAAGGFLACRTARGGERYPQAEDRLALIAPEDRRVF